MKRYAALAVTMALVVAACSGGDSSTTSTDDRIALSGVVDAETLSAIDAAMDELGPDGAFQAVVFAIDDGYDPGQITEAMADGSLGIDGSISGASPSGPAWNLIDRSEGSAYGDVMVLAAAADGLVWAQGPTTLEDFKTDILDVASQLFLRVDRQADRQAEKLNRDASKAAIGILVFWGRAGYTLDQLVESLFFGNKFVVAVADAGRCPAIADGEQLLPPAKNPNFVEPDHPCNAFYDGLRAGDTPATTEAESSTSEPSAVDTGERFDEYLFIARLGDGDEVEWVWTGSFFIDGDQLVGAGSVTGRADSECSIEGGTAFPVIFTATGSFNIVGTAGASTMSVILDPTAGNVDVISGDTSQLCVEISIDIARALAELPLGSVELTDIAIEVPLSGGRITLDFGDGLEVEVSISGA